MTWVNDVSVAYLQALAVAQVTWHGGLDLSDSRHQVIRGCDKLANCTIIGCNVCPWRSAFSKHYCSINRFPRELG